jgi:type IV pilus assembly protein PilE
MKRKAGFSLIEMLIVVAVIAILSAVALPAYRNHVLAGKISEATTRLAEMRLRMEQWYGDNRTYSGGPCTAADGRYFTYSCTAQTASLYTLQAAGVSSAGMAGFTYTLDQSNTRGSVTPWGSSTSCWISKKGESC